MKFHNYHHTIHHASCSLFAKEKLKVGELGSGKRDLVAKISHMKGEMAKVEVEDASGLECRKGDRDRTPVFHFANPTVLSKGEHFVSRYIVNAIYCII